MWYSKSGLRNLALVLLTGMATAFGADEDIRPLVFSDQNSNNQAEYWSDLMAFKIWGTNGLSMGHSVMLDTIGAVGTGKSANFANNNHFIGGPIYIGQTLNDGDGGTYFISGPGRINNYAAGQNESKVNGHFCIGTISSHSDKVSTSGSYHLQDSKVPIDTVYNFNGTITGSNGNGCSDILGFVPNNLEIPTLSGNFPNGVIELNGVKLDNNTFFIDVPPVSSSGKNVYDIRIPSIVTGNNSAIYVRLQSLNVKVRIFVTGELSLSDHTNVLAMIVPAGATYDASSHKWNNADNSRIVTTDEYVGNLLFYTNKDFSLPSMDVNTHLQGTFITPGKMTIGSNLNLVGQLLANDMVIGHDFVGDFRYMPFNAPTISFVKAEEQEFQEDDTWKKVEFSLNEASKSIVSFSYCFEMKANGNDYTADISDFNTSGHSFPVCGSGSGTASVPAGKLTAVDDAGSIWINVKKDGKTEGPEYVGLKIFNLNNGKLPSGAAFGYVKLKLVDADLEPKSADASFTAVEDKPYTVSDKLFKYEAHKDDPSPRSGIIITSLPGKGSLTLNGKKLTSKDVSVSYADLENGKLVYQGAENGYGTSYTTFKFKVQNTKGLASKDEYTMTVNVTPVNDGPTVDNPTVSIDEHKVGNVSGKITVKDVDDNAFTYAFDKTYDKTYTEDDYNAVTSIFTINSSTGVISVKTGKEANFETRESYVVKVKVTDAAASTEGVGKLSAISTVTIKVNDVNEVPSVKGFTATILETAKPGDKVGTALGSDPDTKKPTTWGKITYSIKEASARELFTIDKETGSVIVASGAVFDYETKDSYTFTVVVTDGAGETATDLVKVNIKDVNTPPDIPDINFKPYYVDEHTKKDVVIFKEDVFDDDIDESFTATLKDNNPEKGKTDAGTLFGVKVVKKAGGSAGEYQLVGFVINEEKLDYETLCKEQNCNGGKVFFDVTLTVTDGAGNKVPGNTKIYVNDINEEPSIYDNSFTISEKTKGGTSFGTMKFSDPDLPMTKFGTLTFEIVKNKSTDDIPFVVNSQGTISVEKNAKLDYVKQSKYTFKVKVTDGGNLYDDANVTVNLKDELDLPEFLDMGDAEVDENKAVGFVVATYEVTDPDGHTATLATSLTDNNKVKGVTSAEDLFSSSLVEKKGKYYYQIAVKNSELLDYESLYQGHYNPSSKKVQFDVTLTLTGSKAGAVTSQDIKIVVNDINEAPDAIDRVFAIDENEVYNKVPSADGIDDLASDPDIYNSAFSSLTIDYDKIDAVAGLKHPFIITPSQDEKCGFVLSLRTPVDYETMDPKFKDHMFKFHVTISDGIAEPVTVLFTVKVNDVGEEPTALPQKWDLDEHKPKGHVVGTVTAEDNDKVQGSGLTFELSDVSKGAEGIFEIEQNTGRIKVLNSTKLDYETLKPKNLDEIVLKIKVTGSGGVDVTVPITVNIIDINEQPFAEDAVYSVKENSPKGTVVGTLIASDPDTYNAKFNDLKFFIDETNVPFSISNKAEKNKGVISVADPSKLDYETHPVWKFHVTVTDGLADPVTVNVTVNLSDENDPPTLDLGVDIWNVKENAEKEKVVGKALGQDEDAEDVLTYSMSSENKIALEIFEIDPSTGVVSVKDSSLLDYETLEPTFFDVTITVTDKKDLSDSKNKRINVIDVNEEPVVAKTSLTVKENSIVDTKVGRVNATDPDIKNPKFGTLYYVVQDHVPFYANFFTGDIYVAEGARLNYEKQPTYEFKVLVTDNDYVKYVDVVVTLEDVPEPPTFDEPVQMDVDENVPAGTVVNHGYVWARDPECGDKEGCLTYELIPYNESNDDYKAFVLDPVTAKLTVRNDNSLNFEVKDEYYMRAVVYDGDKDDKSTLSDTITLTIYINDVNDKPVIKDKTVSIEENAKAGTYVGTVTATDEDRWGKVHYTLADDTKGSAALFTINEKTGEVYVAEDAVLDYEQNEIIYVKAIAIDNGKDKGFDNLSDTASLAIKLIDMPEPPVISCVEGDKNCKGPFEVKENSATGFVIHEFVLTDPDKADIGKLKITMEDVSESGADSLFTVKTVDTKTPGVYKLQIVVKDGKKLDYEKVEEMHSIKIFVTDGAGLSTTWSRIIKVVDVNENPIMEPQSFVLKENQAAKTQVGYIVNDDLDTASVFRNNEFSVVGGDTALFYVENGIIYTKRMLDYETDKHTFTLDVKLTDANDDRIFVTETMTIRLKDVAEPPAIDDANFAIDENVPNGTFIGKLTATDPDGESTIERFDVLFPDDYVYVEKDGSVYVKDGSKFDFETVEKIEVPVYVIDEDGLTSDAVMVIKINDVNEKPIAKDQTFKVPEDAPKKTEIGKVTATDPDKDPKFGTLTYKFAENYEKFKIDDKGKITLVGELDYEADSLYKLKVIVSDGENSVTAKVTIKVTNVIERSVVEITRAETKDTVIVKPDTVYTNKTSIDLEWTEDGELKTGTSTLKEGKNVIIKTYKDPTKDFAGSDTVIVFMSTAEPSVTIKTQTEEVKAKNFYTIVEQVDKNDTAYYVKDKMNDILVTVNDKASGVADSFTVKAKLDEINVPSKEISSMSSIADAKLTLDEKATVTKTPVNGEMVKVSYTEKVNGTKVTVSYFTDEKGDVIKQPVMDSKGKVSEIAVITVSKVVTIDGQDVVVSYTADAESGKLLVTDAEGNLMTSAPGKGSDFASKTGVGSFNVTYDYVDSDGDKVTVTYVTNEKGKMVENKEGDTGYSLSYTYKNKFGNTATRSIFVVLDTYIPQVKILSPVEDEVIYGNFVSVEWTVGGEIQDSLTVQSLEKGPNQIFRIYRDKAGNTSIDSVWVNMKNAKNVNISVETPVTIMNLDSVQKYYATNPPEEDETYAISVVNQKTEKEEEVLIGGKKGQKKGSGDEPYPGLDYHVGPTLNIDLRLPIVSAEAGLATLDDVVGSNGMVNIDGVDAADSRKVTVKDFVAKHCTDEFRKELGSDYSKMNLYKTTAYVKIWVYTSTGGFVNDYSFEQELDNPDYADKNGLAKMNFEMKPDLSGEVRTDDGRLLGTGAYVFKSEVTLKSELRCDLPPVDSIVISKKDTTFVNSTNVTSKKGYVMKTNDDLLKKFGYKRPSTENRDASKRSKKDDDDDDDDDSIKSSSSSAKSSSSSKKDSGKSSSSSSKKSSK